MKKIKIITIILSLVLLLGLGWVTYQYYSISKVGETIEPEPTDVIIVLGAGVWEHGPSPALKARLDRALEVYHEGFAQQFILTGGLGDFPPTEAEAMREYLVQAGIPLEEIHLEPLATNTAENLQYSKVIMEEFGWNSAVIVTDVFHMKRALKIASDLRIDASGAPAKNSVLYTNQHLYTMYTLREVLAISVYYVKALL